MPMLRRGAVVVGVCLLAVLAGGCVLGSREPLYDRRREPVFDPRLVGTWRGGEGALIIRRAAGRSYRAATADGAADSIDVDLVPLGGRRYLFPRATQPGVGTVLFPCYQVRVARRELRLRPLDVAALAEQLRRTPGALTYEETPLHAGVSSGGRPASAPATGPAARERVAPNLVLTDSPARIRRYLIDHQDDAELFGEEVVLTKRRGG